MHGPAGNVSLFMVRASPCLLLCIAAACSSAAGDAAEPLLLQHCLCLHCLGLRGADALNCWKVAVRCSFRLLTGKMPELPAELKPERPEHIKHWKGLQVCARSSSCSSMRRVPWLVLTAMSCECMYW